MISWLSLSLVFAGMASLTVWSRLPTKARGLSVLALALAIPTAGGLLLVQRGWAAPIVPYLAELPEGEITVHGAKLIPEVAIYLWLDIAGEPRAFRLPWNAKAASELQRLMEKGEGVKAEKKRTGPADDDFPMELHGAPQPSRPEKQPETAYQYERQGE